MSSQTRKTKRKPSANASPLSANAPRMTHKTDSNTASKSAPRPATAAFVDESEHQQVEIRIPADARWVRMVRLAAAGVASVLDFSVDEIDDIKSAVAEACNNAILHAQPTAHSGTNSGALPIVIVTLVPAREALEIRVEDQGRVADGIAIPAKKQNAATNSGALPVGGLGLLFIETMMDEVRLHSGPDINTTLIMVKKRRHRA